MKLKFLPDYNVEVVKIISAVLIVSMAYFFLLSNLKTFSVAKLKSQDIMTRICRFIKPSPANTDKIIIVTIDDDSFKVLHKRWPWRRLMFAQLINKLSADNPKVISIDSSFMGESAIEEDDMLLDQSLSKANNVLTASYFTSEGEYIKPLKRLADASRGFGFINKPRDDDFYVRRSRAMLPKEDKTIDYSLMLKTLVLFQDATENDIQYDGRNIIIKDTIIPVDKEGTFPIDFRLKLNEFNIVSFWQVLKADFPAETFKDKIILVGPTNEILHDIHNTPLGLMPGVAINANELLMFLNNNFIRDLPAWLEFIIMCIFVLSVAILTYGARSPRVLLKAIGGIIIFWLFGLLLFLKNIRLDYFSPAFLMIASYVGLSGYKYFRLMVENLALATQAITDELTGLFTYRFFVLRLLNELERAKRYKLSLSLVIMDIDHFKNINDTYGHATGNIILKQLSEVLIANTRKADVAFRYGGEELCVILTNTSSAGAFSYAEKIRRSIEQFSFAGAKSIKVTISAGISTFPRDKVDSTEGFINAADSALYQAKGSGRNRIAMFKSKLPTNNTKNL